MKSTAFCIFFIGLSNFHLVFGCGGIGGADENRALTNPSFKWTMNPPVAWTFPDQQAELDLSYFAGQSLTESEAQNKADGDIRAAVLEGMNAIGVSGIGLRIVPNYSPPMVSDCVKGASRTPTAIGEAFGIEEQGAVVKLATPTVAVSLADCQARSFAASMSTFAPFVERGAVTIEGITISGFQAEQLANRMMVSLSFSNRVRFVTEIEVD